MNGPEDITPQSQLPPDNSGKPFALPDGALSDAQLMAYLEGELSPQEQHKLEQLLADDSLESDAIEGLRELGATETRASQKNVRKRLKRALNKREKEKWKLRSNDYVTWTALAIVLLLAIVAFVLVKIAARHI